MHGIAPRGELAVARHAHALAREREQGRNSHLLQMMRVQNRQIDELNRDLERSVGERTQFENESRKASQKNISRVREIITFIKDRFLNI